MNFFAGIAGETVFMEVVHLQEAFDPVDMPVFRFYGQAGKARKIMGMSPVGTNTPEVMEMEQVETHRTFGEAKDPVIMPVYHIRFNIELMQV